MNPSFDELSRKAATGTLTAAERDALDAHLRDRPALRAELEWDAAFAAKLEERVAALPALPGWERTLRLIETEPAPAAAPRPAAGARRAFARGPGILDRLSDWLTATLGMPFNAQAIAVALVVVQAGALGLLAWQTERDSGSAEFRSGSGDPVPRGPLLRVSFKPDLREAELRGLLAGVGAEIVGGPGQLGVYLLRIKDGGLAVAAERLRASGRTELVELVEAKR
ncbi:MAG: hypothetical protein ABI699_10055 [Caldimonas sp.]